MGSALCSRTRYNKHGFFFCDQPEVRVKGLDVMAQVSESLPAISPYAVEAGNFIQMMSDLDSRFTLDFTYESIQRLEGFIAETFDTADMPHSGEQFPKGVGAYVGETIIRTMGGQWNPNGEPEIIGLGALGSTNPVERAMQRFKEGPKASLSWYYQTLRRQYHLTSDEQEPTETARPPVRKSVSGGNVLDRLFGFLLGRS